MKRVIYANCPYDIVAATVPSSEGPVDIKILRIHGEGEIVEFPMAQVDQDQIVAQIQGDDKRGGLEVVREMPSILERGPQPRRRG